MDWRAVVAMEIKFIVEVNVGRLAKWLRVIGYDTLFIPDVDDAQLVRVAQKQGRIVVTRDRYIMQRRVVTSDQVRALLVQSDVFREQMREVTEALGLGFGNGFSLCIECNELLEETSKESVREKVPPFVFSTQDKFLECPECRKLYWRGSHLRNMNVEPVGFKAGA